MLAKKSPIAKKAAVSSAPKKQGFKVRVRSRHPSHNVLRSKLPRMPFRSVVRMGSTTEEVDVDVQCNTIQAVRNSASKLLMKQCFTRSNVTTAPWWTFAPEGFRSSNTNTTHRLDQLPFPMIVKHIYGSRGTGNYKLNTPQELTTWMRGKNLSEYILEQYKNYVREYRLHVTSDGCFYTCRKMLKRDTPEEKKFQRHDDNCVWILEENPSFDKPINWNTIVADCVRALQSLGLDIGAFDLKVQSAVDEKKRPRTNPEWIVIESCSAPSFGDITAQKYCAEIPKILLRKHKEGRA